MSRPACRAAPSTGLRPLAPEMILRTISETAQTLPHGENAFAGGASRTAVRGDVIPFLGADLGAPTPKSGRCPAVAVSCKRCGAPTV